MRTVQTANRNLVEEWNRKLVLRLIKQEASISQIEIIKKSGLSPGTVTNITRKLRKKGFIRNIGLGQSMGGRRPVIFCLNSKARYVISTAFCVEEMRVGILDLTGNILKDVVQPIKPTEEIDTLLKSSWAIAQDLISELSVAKDKVIANCGAFEGMVNPDEGRLIYSAHFNWHNLPAKKMMEEISGLKSYVENRSRANALGEHWFGAGKGLNNLLCISVDSGIGSAIISKGQIYHGLHQMEGEIGHTVVCPAGLPCKCGRRGCLETVASGSAILRKAIKQGKKKDFGGVNLNKLSNRQALKMVFKAAEEGNHTARQMVTESGYHLGTTVAGMVNLIDPELVILFGYVIDEDTGIFLRTIQESYQKLVLNHEFREVKIVKGLLGKDGILVGGAILSYQDVFYAPTLH